MTFIQALVVQALWPIDKLVVVLCQTLSLAPHLTMLLGLLWIPTPFQVEIIVQTPMKPLSTLSPQQPQQSICFFSLLHLPRVSWHSKIQCYYPPSPENTLGWRYHLMILINPSSSHPSVHTPLAHTTKCSCHMESVQAATGSSRKNNTSIALYTVDSSIWHLDDMLSKNFVDLLKTIQSAVGLIYIIPGLPAEHQQFFTTHVSLNPAAGVVLNSLPDNVSYITYISDWYTAHNPPGASGSMGPQ